MAEGAGLVIRQSYSLRSIDTIVNL